MHAFVALLVPTALSAVAVFILSSLVHMVLPWHKHDFSKLPNQDGVMDALRPFSLVPGEYLMPRPDKPGDLKSPEFLARMERRPVALLNVMPNGPIGMGRPLGLWIVYCFLVSWLAGHVAWGAFGPAEHGSKVIFHTIALATFLGYAGALWQGVIWYRRPAM